MNLTDFMTWEALRTYAGALAMVLILTQLTKNLSFTKKIPTQIWSYILALIVLLSATFITEGWDPNLLLLCFFNAALISLATNAGFTGAQKIFGNATDGNLLIDTTNPDKDIYRFDVGTNLETLSTKKTVTLKVNNNVCLTDTSIDKKEDPLD